jgi:hypothetical protein
LRFTKVALMRAAIFNRPRLSPAPPFSNALNSRVRTTLPGITASANLLPEALGFGVTSPHAGYRTGYSLLFVSLRAQNGPARLLASVSLTHCLAATCVQRAGDGIRTRDIQLGKATTRIAFFRRFPSELTHSTRAKRLCKPLHSYARFLRDLR